MSIGHLLVRFLAVVLLAAGAPWVGAYPLPKVTPQGTAETSPTISFAPAAPSQNLPAGAVVHVPPGIPQFGETMMRWVYRNTSNTTLFGTWRGFITGGTDRLAMGVWADGAGEAYWNWYYNFRKHPANLPNIPKSFLVQPGDYVIVLTGFTYITASYNSLAPEWSSPVGGLPREVRFRVKRGTGVAMLSQVLPALFAGEKQTLASTLFWSEFPGMQDLRIDPLPAMPSLPNGGWRFTLTVDANQAKAGLRTLATYSLQSGSSSEGKALVSVHVAEGGPELSMTPDLLALGGLRIADGTDTGEIPVARGGFGAWLRVRPNGTRLTSAEFQLSEPGSSMWTAAGTFIFTNPGPQLDALGTTRATTPFLLGKPRPGFPLAPALDNLPHASQWRLRARVIPQTGDPSPWIETNLVGRLPLANLQIPARTLPPTDSRGPWFSPSPTVLIPVDAWTVD